MKVQQISSRSWAKYTLEMQRLGLGKLQATHRANALLVDGAMGR